MQCGEKKPFFKTEKKTINIQKYFDGVIFPGKSCSCRNILMVCYIQAKVARGCRRKERRLQLNRLLCLKMCINKVWLLILYHKMDLMILGHSCKIGNAPILDANIQYFIFPVLLWYFWYYFVLRYMKKERGQLEKI